LSQAIVHGDIQARADRQAVATGEAIERWRDKAFLAGWLIVGGAGDALRAFGGAPFVLAFALLAYSGGTYYLRRDARLPLALSGFAFVYVLLSFLHVLPGGWTRFYERSIIINEAGSVVAFGIMLISAHRWWDRVRSGHVSAFYVGALAIVSLFLEALWEVALGGGEGSLLSTLRNGAVAFLVISAYYSFRGKLVWSLGILGLLVSLFINPTGYLQTLLTFALFGGFYALKTLNIPAGRLASFGFIALALTLTVIGMSNPDTVFWNVDRNTGWRLMFWKDALECVGLTGGVGVGFGTEALTNFYPVVQREFFPDSKIETSFMLIGTHNGFMDTTLRLGVVGLVLLIATFLTCIPVRDRSASRSSAAGFAFCVAFLCAYLNVALQSPLYAVGISFSLGLARSLRATAEVEDREPAKRNPRRWRRASYRRQAAAEI
jgi:hypothetical protein